MFEKIKYESFYEAKKVLNAASKIGRVYGKSKRRLTTYKPKRVYRCQFCGYYHLTSKLKNKFKNIYHEK